MDAETVIAALHSLREDMQANHIEVVQRLTTLETLQSTHEDLGARVTALEGWRNKIAGGLVVVSMIVTSAITWIARIKRQ